MQRQGAVYKARIVMGYDEIFAIWDEAALWVLQSKVRARYTGSFHSMRDLFSARTKLPSIWSSAPK